MSRGLYARMLGGGQVDISNGNFVFEVREGYLIEGGRLTAPVKNATLIGVGPEVLGRISMVGSDLALDPGTGTCGKDGQSVRTVGVPTGSQSVEPGYSDLRDFHRNIYVFWRRCRYKVVAKTLNPSPSGRGPG